METRYRILKRYWRREEDGKVCHYFQPQYLGKTLSLRPPFWRLKWKNCKRKVCFMYDCYKQSVHFDTWQEAHDYINNLREPVYEDEPIYG